MAVSSKKAIVLKALENQRQAVSLPQLMMLLPNDYAERSVRRWLTELAEDGKVIKRGQKRGTRYQLASAATTQSAVPEPASLFSDASALALSYVRQPLFKRKPVTYNYDWFDSYQPNQTHYFQPVQTKELAQQGQRASHQEPAGTYARKIYSRLLIDLSFHSSRLEGNTYSLIDTERLLIDGAGVAGKLNEEKVMILNHKEAIRHLVDNAHRIAINYDEVCTLHYLLADGLVPVQYNGRVRDHAVRIGASTYAPLEGEMRLNQQLRAIVSKANLIMNPYEQSLFLLVHVAYLQAFSDVNKRTSRLCANIPLIKKNLVPLSFNAIEKDDYASAMIAIYELNDVQPLTDLYHTSYLYSCQQYDASAEAMGFDEIRVRYRQERRGIIREIIVSQLTGIAMHEYIHDNAVPCVAEIDLELFIEDINEDLGAISPRTIAGMGISVEQLQSWLELK